MQDMAATPAAAATGGVRAKQETRPDPAGKTTDGDDDEGISWQLSVKDMIIPKLNTDEDDSPITIQLGPPTRETQIAPPSRPRRA